MTATATPPIADSSPSTTTTNTTGPSPRTYDVHRAHVALAVKAGMIAEADAVKAETLRGPGTFGERLEAAGLAKAASAEVDRHVLYRLERFEDRTLARVAIARGHLDVDLAQRFLDQQKVRYRDLGRMPRLARYLVHRGVLSREQALALVGARDALLIERFGPAPRKASDVEAADEAPVEATAVEAAALEPAPEPYAPEQELDPGAFEPPSERIPPSPYRKPRAKPLSPTATASAMTPVPVPSDRGGPLLGGLVLMALLLGAAGAMILGGGWALLLHLAG